MPWEKQIQPKYSMLLPHWDGVVMTEHVTRQASIVEPLGMAWFGSEDVGHYDATSGEAEEEEVARFGDMLWGD